MVAPSFTSQLLPASFRGVPFGVIGGDASVGRRNAVHEYPFRDTQWAEDLGRSARHIRVQGFVVGDDAIAKRARLIEAAERPGDGELVHPTFGRIKVALLDFQMSEKWDQGRVFELAFTFIEQGLRQFPATGKSTSDAVLVNAAMANAAASEAFAARAGASFQRGDAVLQEAKASAASWGGSATTATNDATTLLHLTDIPSSDGQPVTIKSLVGEAAAARQTVEAARLALNAGAAGLTTSSAVGYGGAVQAMADAVRSASPRPADAIRAMVALIAFSPIITTDTSPTGAALAAVQAASRDLFRRAAVVGAAISATEYQPTSNDDAAAMRNRVLALLDDEITNAGDLGEDDVFASLRALRSTVAQDLNARGAGLPDEVLISSAQPVPSLVLAQRLYRDLTRADELEAEANAVHPAFMPVAFKGLSS